MVVWGWCDPIQVSFLSLEFLKKLLQMALGAVPKIDFRDEKMRECIDNLRQMINSDTDTEIVRGPLGLARNEYSGCPCWVPFPIWTNYCLGHDSFVTKLNTLHTAEELSKVGFWSANIFSALATEPVTIFIGNWIKFKISSEGVALSRAWSCPLYIRHFSVDTAYHLATGLKGPICIDCTPLSLRGGSVNWINPPPPTPGDQTVIPLMLIICLHQNIVYSSLRSPDFFTSLAEGIQCTPSMVGDPDPLAWHGVMRAVLSLVLLIKH